jgi:hypothetical protein
VQEKELLLLLQIFEANFVCKSREEAHGKERERERRWVRTFFGGVLEL